MIYSVRATSQHAGAGVRVPVDADRGRASTARLARAGSGPDRVSCLQGSPRSPGQGTARRAVAHSRRCRVGLFCEP